MKNRLIFSSFFSLGCFLSLFLVLGCGGAEDAEEASNSTYYTLLDEPEVEESDLTTAEYWEQFKDENWIRLTDAEVEELLNLEIPKDWGFRTKDEALRQKYSHARSFQELGDIPPVRYMVEFERQHRKEKGKAVILTLALVKQTAAHSEALYFLFPTENNRRSLEYNRKLVEELEEEEEHDLLEQLRIKDPQAWIKRMRAFLIRKHGNIPTVDTIANFLWKLELNLPRADKECFAYLNAYADLYNDSNIVSAYEVYAVLEATDQLRHIVGDPPKRTDALEKYREARAEGISFYDIEWDDD